MRLDTLLRILLVLAVFAGLGYGWHFIASNSDCEDPLGRATLASLKEHPEEWKADDYYLLNTQRDINIWRNDLWLLNPPHPYTTYACRVAINSAIAPIYRRTVREQGDALIERLAD